MPDQKIDAIVDEVNTEFEQGAPAMSIEPYDLTKWSLSRFQGEPAPMSFLVNDLIPQGVAGTFYSAGGAGKSTLALDLSIRIAIAQEYRTKWLDKFDILEGGKVLYLSAEEPEKILHRRVHGLLDVIAAEVGTDLNTLQQKAQQNLFPINLWGSASQLFRVKSASIEISDEYERLRRTLQEAGDVRLVVLDTRSRLSGAEGAGNAIVSQEIAYYEKLAADFGATVLILHHTNKASYQNDVHSGAAQRGESAFLDCLRFGLYLQSMTPEAAKQQDITEEERSKYLTLTHAKGNYTTIQEPVIIYRRGFTFELTDLKARASKEEVKAGKEQAAICAITDLVRENPGIVQSRLIQLLAEKGFSYHGARDAIKNAAALECILETFGKQNRKIYSLPADPETG